LLAATGAESGAPQPPIVETAIIEIAIVVIAIVDVTSGKALTDLMKSSTLLIFVFLW